MDSTAVQDSQAADSSESVDSSHPMVDSGCPGAETMCGGTCVDTSTSLQNCGACGSVCSGTCVSGRCELTLWTGAGTLQGIAIDATYAYFTVNDGPLMRVPKGGGTVTTLVSTGAEEVAVDTGSIYWGSAAGSASSIVKANLDGSNPVTLAAANAPGTIVLDDLHVYWNDFLGGGVSAITSVPKAGGTPATIASGDAYFGLALEGSNLYWADLAGPNPWVSTILGSPIGGGTMATLGSATNEAAVWVVADLSRVYWDTQEGDVLSVPLGGGPMTSLVSGGVFGDGMFVDGTNLYYAGNGIRRLPVTGGTPEVLAGNQTQTFEVAVDATTVYWTGSEGVFQISK